MAALHGLTRNSLVVVSFVGSTGYDHPHVFAEGGRTYEWGFLVGLRAMVALRPGVNAGYALAAIFDTADLMQSYPAVIDVEHRHLAFLVGNRPLQLWPVKPDTDLWREFFT